MFGLSEHLISPFVTGYEGTAIESLYPSNTDMMLKAKAQGAVTGYVHPYNGDNDPLLGNLGEERDLWLMRRSARPMRWSV